MVRPLFVLLALMMFAAPAVAEDAAEVAPLDHGAEDDHEDSPGVGVLLTVFGLAAVAYRRRS